ISVPLYMLYLVVTMPLYVAGVLFEIAHSGPEGADSMWRSIRNAQLEVLRWLFGPTRQGDRHEEEAHNRRSSARPRQALRASTACSAATALPPTISARGIPMSSHAPTTYGM